LKKILVYTQGGHADKTAWVNHLVHPVRAYWGDGTSEWLKHKKDFVFFTKYFELTDNVKDCEVAFLPLTLNYYFKNNKSHLLKNFIKVVSKNKKKTFIWVDGDHQNRFNDLDCIFLKYSGYKSKLNGNEFILPGDVKQDLLGSFLNGKLILKEKSKKPRIGFDGIANYNSLKLIGLIGKNFLYNINYKIFKYPFEGDPVIPYFLKRKHILNMLESSSEIEKNFSIRDTFAVGTVGKDNKSRNEYINNILSSDYTLCYRGASNYSLRFYETLCLGRIPLFINTDCKLPFENNINWKEVCLWIEESELYQISDKILDYHHSLTESQFKEKQLYCRELWVKYCSKEGFYKEFFEFLRNNIK
tara:strand:+ start:206 stop:1279 length:1074 start_codon:yes stop_codon:yes gene_type:complete